MTELALSDKEFSHFQKMIYDIAGISMSPVKKPLVCSRLGKRVKYYSLGSYEDYFKLLTKNSEDGELQVAIDLLTTNETHFFREPKHFEFLRDKVLPARKPGRPFRIWSAASSSGEEPYSIAMLLADVLGETTWEIMASDISSRILAQARSGLYPIERVDEIPKQYLLRFCLKGTGSQDGKFIITKELRDHVQYRQINLNEPLPKLGEFDVIFLRNVMIYFDMETSGGTYVAPAGTRRVSFHRSFRKFERGNR